jgi:hypothetical protein
LDDPFLGADILGGAYSQGLQTLGTASIAQGLPASFLLSLGCYDVWETLIPGDFDSITAGADGAQGISGQDMTDGDVAYLTANTVVNPVPEPAAAGILGVALFGLAGLRRRRC